VLAYDFPKPGRWFYEDPYTSGNYRTSYLLADDGELFAGGWRQIVISGPDYHAVL